MAEEKSNSRAYSLRMAPPDKGFPNIPSMVLLVMTRSEIIILKNMVQMIMLKTVKMLKMLKMVMGQMMVVIMVKTVKMLKMLRIL